MTKLKKNAILFNVVFSFDHLVEKVIFFKYVPKNGKFRIAIYKVQSRNITS